MKKLAKIFTIVAFIAILTTTVVNASASDDLIAELSKSRTIGGKTVTLSASDRVKLERYLSEHPITEEEKNSIVANVDEAVAIMEAEGTADLSKLSADAKEKITTLAKAAASEMDLTLVVDTVGNTIKVYDENGTLIESARVENGTLAYTGNNSFVYIVAPVVAIIAIAAVVIGKKVNA